MQSIMLHLTSLKIYHQCLFLYIEQITLYRNIYMITDRPFARKFLVCTNKKIQILIWKFCKNFLSRRGKKYKRLTRGQLLYSTIFSKIFDMFTPINIAFVFLVTKCFAVTRLHNQLLQRLRHFWDFGLFIQNLLHTDVNISSRILVKTI